MILIALLLAFLPSCSVGNQPFLKSDDENAKRSGATPPPITLKPLKGIPDDKAKMFADMLAEAAAKRDIAVVQGTFPDSFRLAGVFRVQSNSAGTVVSYQWQLDDSAGKPLHSFSGVEQAGVAAGDLWKAVFPDVLRRIAAGTTENLASRLAQMGYATRTAGLPPPALSFVLASPTDAKEIDIETVLGPGKAAENGEVASLTATEAQPSGAATHPPAAEAQPSAAATPPPAAKPRQGGEAIRAIALTSVVGSPADDDTQLRDALKAVLIGAGWPVVDQPQPDALTVTGRVNVAEPKDGTQRVDLAWNVRAPSGRDLGTVRQSNSVAAGSLEGGWSETAVVVAEAAATGLFDLVRRLR